MPRLHPKAGCCILSLLIPNTDIHNLYHNGQKIKAAYFNGEQVWLEKHRVRWYDNLGNLIKTEWVTDGEAAMPPNVTDFSTEFYGYTFSGWNNEYSVITGDTDIYASTVTETMYIFRKSYGINPDYEIGFAAEFYDGSTIYSKSAGRSDTDRITLSVSAANGAYENTRKSSSVTFRLDCDALRTQGLTKLNVMGSYAITTTVSGHKIAAYTASNVRSVFAALTDNPGKIAVSTSGISGIDAVIQKSFTVSKMTSGNYGFASDSSGTLSGSLTLPESGIYYLVLGAVQKNTRAKTTININNIQIE